MNWYSINKKLIKNGFLESSLYLISKKNSDKIKKNEPITEKQKKELIKITDSPKQIIVALFPVPTENSITPTLDSTLYDITAPFAKHNYYKFIVKQLKIISSEIRNSSNLKKSDIRIFCNSILPEKLFALWGNLGFIGKNNLLINSKLGSSVLICGMILPNNSIETQKVVEANTKLPSFGKLCRECSLCINNCPVSALTDKDMFIKTDCLQYQSSQLIKLPDKSLDNWGGTFYGCQKCLEICPFYKTTIDGIQNKKNVALLNLQTVSQNITIRQIINLPDKEAIDLLTNVLKKTTLGQKWIKKEALLRNIKLIVQNIIE